MMTLETFWERLRVHVPDVTWKEASFYYYGRWGVGDAAQALKQARK